MKRVRDRLHPEQRARRDDLVQPDANSSSSLASGICRTKVPQIRRPAAGFTLIEMAVAVFILALLLGSILVPLQTQIESRKTDETQRMLDQAREALLGFAAANGYFPCPASTSSNGQQATGAGHPGTGTCAVAVIGANIYHGFLPAATLGFTPVDAQGYAVDAWGLTKNRIRYAVSTVTVNGVTLPFTKTNGMKNAGMSNIAAATTLLHVCNSGTGVTPGTNCNTAVTLASSVPVVIWSVGPNAATSGGASVDEQQNPNPSANPQTPDRIFVSRTKSSGTSGEFDDIVTWIGSATIFNRLIAAGQLP
jgi:prepilin-type N-terminal cleavage/methylation domain-containing protein